MFLLLLVISKFDFKILVLFGQFRNFKVSNCVSCLLLKLKSQNRRNLLRIMILDAESCIFIVMLSCEHHFTMLVTNAMFSLLKLLIYEPYYYYALVGWSARSRLEPSQAIGTIRALPRPPSTRLGCHTSVCIYLFFVGLMFSPLGTAFPLLCVYTVKHPL